MIRALLKYFGYYKIDYGFSCGRHWVKIDEKIIAQTPGDDIYMPDEYVHALGYFVVDHGKHWVRP